MIFIFATIFLFGSCHKEDDDNVYDSLIPPYSFPDTCEGKYYAKLLNYNFDKDVLFAPDEGFYIVTSDELIGIDSSGNELWTYPLGFIRSASKSSDGSIFIIDGYNESLNKIDSSGNFIWDILVDYRSGLISSFDGGCIMKNPDQKLTKIDGNGNTIWVADLSNRLTSMLYVVPTLDNGVIATGDTVEVYSSTATQVYYKKPHKIFKLNSQGLISWELKIDYGNSTTELGAGIVESNGNYFFIVSDYAASDNSYYIYKIDSSGQLVAEKSISQTSDISFGQFMSMSDGGFLLIGSDPSLKDIVVIKLNSLLGEEWRRYYGGTSIDYGHRAKETPQNDLLIIGEAWGYDGTSRNKVSRLYVLKTDPSGNTCK